jgi:hypothetical protein
MQHALDEHGEAVDFSRRRALNLPEAARFDGILKTPKDGSGLFFIKRLFLILTFDSNRFRPKWALEPSEQNTKSLGGLAVTLSRYHSRQALPFQGFFGRGMATSAWPWSVRRRSAIDGGFALVATTCH